MLVALVDTLKQLRYQIAHLEDNTLQSEYPELASFIQQVSLTVTESKADLNFLYQFLYVYALDVQDYLWNSYLKTTIDVGTGISAMPSMHLSIAALLYFSAKELNKNFGYAMLIFLILIQIGSVHLGWHYAIDGYVSIFLTWLIWKSMGYLCDKIYNEE